MTFYDENGELLQNVNCTNCDTKRCMDCTDCKRLSLSFGCTNCTDGTYLINCEGKSGVYCIRNTHYGNQAAFFEAVSQLSGGPRFIEYCQLAEQADQHNYYAKKKEEIKQKKKTNNKFGDLEVDVETDTCTIEVEQVVEKSHPVQISTTYIQEDNPETKAVLPIEKISEKMWKRYKDQIHFKTIPQGKRLILVVRYYDFVFYEYEGQEERIYEWILIDESKIL